MFKDLSPDQLEDYVNSGKLLTDFGHKESEAIPGVKAPDAPPQASKQESIVEEAIRSSRTLIPERVEGFAFENPVELLFFLDDNISSGRIKLHKWQIQIMLDFASPLHTDNNPFQALVRACNGSGKDKFVIAPCAVWLNMRYLKARGIVTSSSGVQLDNQTGAYIDQLCEAANRKIAPTIWKINYRYYECLATGSPLLLFATDEPGKAEGYHPLDPDAKMGVYVSEDKSVPDEINLALNKCTGYTHRLHVSTPGLPMGHFYDYCSTSKFRKEIKEIKEVASIDFIQYHITAYDCSHLSLNYIEQMKRDLPGGESGAAFKSQVMAEFGTTDEMVVIPYTYIWKASHNPPIGWLKEPYNKGGLDLSAGGDETCLTIRNGNKILKTVAFRFDNTMDTVNFLVQKFEENGLKNPLATIFADAGGLGKPIIDRLRELGWSNIRYVLNQNKAYDERVYVNRGAEMWFNFGKCLERGEIYNDSHDDKLNRQLATRYYKITPQNKHQLESKLQARAKGHPSPDRADSCVLAFADYKSKLEEKPYEKPYKVEEPKPPVPIFDLRVWAKPSNDEMQKYPRVSIAKNREFLMEQLHEINKQQTTVIT